MHCNQVEKEGKEKEGYTQIILIIFSEELNFFNIIDLFILNFSIATHCSLM